MTKWLLTILVMTCCATSALAWNQFGHMTAAAIAYCQQHPQWRLSIQTHKLLNIR